ncbi:MAG: FHA domain-containing protein, partial [Actinomycetota bacterium]|nr:FHA domain-containing protein [Actinomycetota bacterium]
ETLHTGQFRTSSSVDPDAPQPRTAGDRAMSQQQGEPPEHGQRDQYAAHRGYGHDQGPDGNDANLNYGQPYGYDFQHNQAQGHPRNPGSQTHGNQNYGAQSYDSPGRYDRSYPQYGYDQGRSDEQGQGGYGYESGYEQRQPAPGQDYQQSYGDPHYGQYGGAQPGYGYEQGGYGGQKYGADPDYSTQGYLPPAVQTGSRQLAASLILDDGSNRHYQLTEGATVVGRGQEAQFRLPDTGVSRRHFEITWDGWTATLADLGSTNGTTVNGTPVQTWQLADGDVVRVGHSSLVFRTQG